MTSSFREIVAASMPAGLPLPNEVGEVLAWMEEHDCVGRYTHTDEWYGGLYPVGDVAGQYSSVAFYAADPSVVKAWLRSDDPAVLGRLAIMVRTGGDGSAAGLWRDDDGQPRFVHLGSGSGSTLACTLATSPIDFLRFLAIGYSEPCWDGDFDRSPADVAADNDEVGYEPPHLFRSFIEQRFKVTVPTVASEIVRVVAHLGDANSPDPFCSWLAEIQDD